ncbi:MAG: hypothetical protein V1875_01145 [Candidatus Altiarchaeota archaeon]
MAEGSPPIIRLLLLFTVVVVVVTFSILSYSASGYTFVKYPGVDGLAVVCIEGEAGPTNQTITVMNAGKNSTVNPYVEVNGVRYVFNYSVDETGVRQATDELVLGCNNVSFGADSEGRFKVRIDYLSHWRPVVKTLEINNLMAGHSSRYFISTQDGESGRIVRSRLNITDITRDTDRQPRYDLEFNGSAVRYRLEEPGNYKAAIQVYDGYVWSDAYEVGYTAHVIQTDDVKRAYRTYEVGDDPVQEHGGILPVAIKPSDGDAMRMAKRAVDGGYVLGKRCLDFLKGEYVSLTEEG